MSNGAEKIIYSMMRVSKSYNNSKVVLKDISLSYFYGAKIGVLGLNGSGKSSLLRIMAGRGQGVQRRSRCSRRDTPWDSWSRSRSSIRTRPSRRSSKRACRPS